MLLSAAVKDVFHQDTKSRSCSKKKLCETFCLRVVVANISNHIIITQDNIKAIVIPTLHK